MVGTSKSRIGAFFASDIAGGVVLMAAAGLAIAVVNSPLAWLYDALLETPITIRVGAFALDKSLLMWVNEGLMAIFFFLVGLEIKRELIEGQLSSWRRATLPAVAAAGGMLVPALIYSAVNAGDPVALRGWAIPAATDIAFALGALALIGNRITAQLKVFLLALAILDDLGVVVIIAIFYTGDLSLVSLVLAALGIGILAAMNRRGVDRLLPYLVVGAFIWVCVLKSGVHATLAGAVLALFIPLRRHEAGSPSLLHRVEHALTPWVTLGVMPAFAFVNAGVSFGDMSLAHVMATIPAGITLGLFLGKQAGIMTASWLAVRAGLCSLPPGVSWRQMYGVAVLAGIGFTMSLFIGSLAFEDPTREIAVRIGVLSGSLLSGIAGYLILRRSIGPVSTRESAHSPASSG